MQEGRKKGTTPVLPSCIPAFLMKNANSQSWNKERRKTGKKALL
jgi:hypothetical protein